MRPWNKINNINMKKQLEYRTKRRLRMMSEDYFIPVRPTLLEIRRDKLEKIKKKIDARF